MHLKILSEDSGEADWGKYKTLVLEGFPDLPYDRFGVDPGIRNMGFAKVRNETAFIHQISFIQETDTFKRMMLVWKALGMLTGVVSYHPHLVVEAASYNNHFGQVQLAEMRAAAILYFWRYEISPLVIPPKKVRKAVLGDAKLKGFGIGLPPDAEAALVCALYMESEDDTVSSS